jgi:hypothetical protein
VYRNDRDAALARIDALERDNTRLAAENTKLKANAPVAPPAVVRRPLGAYLIAPGLLAAAVIVSATMWGARNPTPTSDHDSSFVSSVPSRSPLEDCARTLAPKPSREDPLSELRRAPVVLSPIFRAGCRDEVYARLTRGVILPDERSVLQRWLDAEDALASTRSLLDTATDDATLRRLRRDYDVVYEERQTAIDEWRHAIR